MPVEIRELNIKINLSEGEGNVSSTNANDPNEAQQGIIEAVIEKVLEILKEREER